MATVFLILALIAFIVGLVCCILLVSVNKALKGGVTLTDVMTKKAKLPRIAQRAIHKAASNGVTEIKLAIKPFTSKVLIVNIVAWAISLFTLMIGLAILILELTVLGSLSIDYTTGDADEDCTCIAECVYGAKTCDFSKTSYDERALWANGFYLTHDPYNSAAFMNYALYVQSMGAFKAPATDTARKIVPAEVKWSEGTEYECTFADIMGEEDYPIIFIHYSFGEVDASDMYIYVDSNGSSHAIYINTAFYRAKHETYLKGEHPDLTFALTNDSEHSYIQSLLDASAGANYYADTAVTAEDWENYPEVSATVGQLFCLTFEYARNHKADDGTQTDYKSMVSELAAYAKWFYNGEAKEGILSELSESDYYAYGGQVMDTSDDNGYKFVPAYSSDDVYTEYYTHWVTRYGDSDESLADMLYYIMRDNKRCGTNSLCGACHEVMGNCEGAPWWMDYTGLFRYVENTRVGFEYPEGKRRPGGGQVISDIRPQAMAIAQEMMSPVAYHVRSGCTCVIKDTNIPHKWYCVKGGYDSQLIPAHFYACCGGGSTATAVLAGLTEPGSVNSGGTVACPEDYTIAFGGANADLTLTYADIPVGSIICGGDNAPPETVLNLKPGQGLGSDHCTILVYKDATKAYIAGFGGDAPIEDIAAKGWRSSYDINALAKSEVSGRAYIYIYTPNRQAGGSGDMPDVDGYANPTDIESGRFDVNLLEGAGVDVGFRRFEGSWYTQLNGWTQASSVSKTVSSGSDTYALYDSPPYVFSDFSKAYFYDLNYCGVDMQNWWNATAAEWGITVNNEGLQKWSGIHTDDQPNTYADNSFATTYAKTYTTNAGYSMPGVAAHPYFSVYGPGGEPAVDSYWEKYHDVSGMYGDLGYFSDVNSDNLYYKGAYNCPCILVLQEASTGKIYYMPVGFTDSSGHNYPIGSGQTYRAARNGYAWATTDINDPNAILAFAWNGWDPMYWPLCANVDKTTGEVGYVNRRNPLSIDILREYGCPSTHTITGPHELAYVTVYDYIKWMSENRAVHEGVSGASNLHTYFTKFECKPNLKSFLDSGSYSMKGIIMCSTQTEGTGSSSGHNYDPSNPNPMPDSGGGGSSSNHASITGLDCSIPYTAQELQGSEQAGSTFSTAYNGRTLAIYTPYGYDSSGSTKYPVAIIKQGLSCGASGDWFTNAAKFLDYHIANGSMQPIILVSVQGEGVGSSVWLPSNLDGLITFLETNYNVSSNARDRIVGGMSQGSIELRRTDQSVVSKFGLAYMGSAYLSTDWVGRFSSEPRPSYLCVVTAGSADATDCINSYNYAQEVAPNSNGKLFAQMIQGDTHNTAACMRNFMRISEWYFKK